MSRLVVSGLNNDEKRVLRYICFNRIIIEAGCRGIRHTPNMLDADWSFVIQGCYLTVPYVASAAGPYLHTTVEGYQHGL